jgi:hypothetical protein
LEKTAMSHYKETERTAWGEKLESLFSQASAEFVSDAKNRNTARWHRFQVGVGFLVLALLAVVSLYWMLPRLVAGAASSALTDLDNIRRTVREAEDQLRNSYETLTVAREDATKAVATLQDSVIKIPKDNLAIVHSLRAISGQLFDLSKAQQELRDAQWLGLSKLIAKKQDIDDLVAAISQGVPTPAAPDGAPVVAVSYTNVRQLESVLAESKSAVMALSQFNTQFGEFANEMKKLGELAKPQSGQPSALEAVTKPSADADIALTAAQRAINDQLAPSFTRLADEMKILQQASSKISATADKLNDASGIGTGPVAYTVLAIVAMLATFGVSALWRWSKSYDDERAARDRYFAAQLIATNAVMLASRNGADADGGRADTAAILATIERAILGIRQPKEASIPVPLPALTTAGEIINIIRGDKLPSKPGG